MWGSPWDNSWPLLIITPHTNGIPPLNTSSETATFATALLTSRTNFHNSCSASNTVPYHMGKCFTANNMALNLDTTNIIKFITNNSPQYTLCIGYIKNIQSVSKGKIPWFTNWSTSKSEESYWPNDLLHVRHLGHICSDTLKTIYFAYLYSITRYETIWVGAGGINLQ
jgi:hypothetical protein